MSFFYGVEMAFGGVASQKKMIELVNKSLPFHSSSRLRLPGRGRGQALSLV